MNPITYIPESLLTNNTINPDNICYSMRLSGIKKRKTTPAAQGTFSSLMSGLSNAITSVITDACLIRMTNSEVWIVSEKNAPVHINLSDINKSAEIHPGEVRASLFFQTGELESATYTLNSDNMLTSFGGNLKQFLEDFSNMQCENLPGDFFSVIISKNTKSPELYSFAQTANSSTLISYDNNGIHLINQRRKIAYSSIVAIHQSNGYTAILFRENNEYLFAEIMKSLPAQLPVQDLNLIRNTGSYEKSVSLPFPDGILRANSFIAAFSVNSLSLFSIDDKLYSVKGNGVAECGVFKSEADIYVKTSDGETLKYPGCERITDVLSLLPSGYSQIFMTPDVPQPFLCNGNIISFTHDKAAIKSESYTFEFSKMTDCHYMADDFSCTITFTYNGEKFTLCTANPLGVHICKTQEKVYVSTLAESYTINQLYDCYYQRCSENYLACTFSEIFKTEKLLSVDNSPSELIAALYAEDSPVLRNTFQSILGNFKVIDDLQSALIQKVTLLEIQRKKIQKLYDEWALYYPHYLATIQVQWLRYVFGDDVSSKTLDNEYWKCVNFHKRILSGSNNYIQNTMSEIGSCVENISEALPDEAKRTDVATNLRINPNIAQNILKRGTDALHATTAGLELSNIFLNGISAANPLAISMTAKMLVDSYTKDLTLRKNIRTFGLQALEWWEIFIKGIRIQIMELSHAFTTYNKMCIKRDIELFKSLADDKKEQVKVKLAGGLKMKISESIDDKFMEVLPQFNLRISDIIENLDAAGSALPDIIDDFKNNLYI